MSSSYVYTLQREFLKTRFSRCMLYRHNAAIGTDLNLVFWNNSFYICSNEISFKKIAESFSREIFLLKYITYRAKKCTEKVFYPQLIFLASFCSFSDIKDEMTLKTRKKST